MAASKIILIVEDSACECRMLSEAIRQSGIAVDVRCVKDHEMLLKYLTRTGPYGNAKDHPAPSLILLDLDNGGDGMGILKKIKSHPDLRRIPLVAMTSKSEDAPAVYEIGANSFIDMPSKASDFASAVKTIYQYWFENVELPTAN